MSIPASAAVPVAGIPEKIGRFAIIRQIGRGSSGVVYLARDAYNDRDVALKLYSSSEQADSEQASIERNMFLSEAHLVGMLQHPYILPIYDAGEENGRCYIVTEHVHGGRTLQAYCRPGNLLPVAKVVELILKCAKALHYAHASGVIHRDIKPSNILLTHQGDVRIIDFGVALVADAHDKPVSRVEGIAGSPSYMSPEQVQGLPLSNRSDLYSLGAVMYELLAGVRPFKADNLEKLMNLIIYATPAPIHSMRREVPEEIEKVVARALQKDPERRYKSGLDFAAELTRLHRRLRDDAPGAEQRARCEALRTLSFFHDFSHAEVAEVLSAGIWQSYAPGDEIVREGERDDRFYIVISGSCSVQRGGVETGKLASGDCFGESSYVPGLRRDSMVRALEHAEVLRVSATLLEQLSSSCQLHFSRVFLRRLVTRLHRVETDQSAQS